MPPSEATSQYPPSSPVWAMPTMGWLSGCVGSVAEVAGIAAVSRRHRWSSPGSSRSRRCPRARWRARAAAVSQGQHGVARDRARPDRSTCPPCTTVGGERDDFAAGVGRGGAAGSRRRQAKSSAAAPLKLEGDRRLEPVVFVMVKLCGPTKVPRVASPKLRLADRHRQRRCRRAGAAGDTGAATSDSAPTRMLHNSSEVKRRTSVVMANRLRFPGCRGSPAARRLATTERTWRRGDGWRSSLTDVPACRRAGLSDEHV